MAVFHLRRSSDDRFYFVAYARFGPRLIQSGSYGTSAAARHAVEICRTASSDKSRYQPLESGRDKYYFNMIDLSDAYLASSDTFDTIHRRDETINYCCERLPKAGVTDETLTPPSAD